MDVASLRVKVVNEGMDAATKGLDEVTKSADKAEKSVGKLEKAEKKIKKFNDNLSGLRNAALGMGAALGGALYKTIGAAQQFESSMADVKKVIDFDTPQGFANMRKDLLDLSKEIPITADGLAQIAAAAGQSGIAADEIARFTESAAKMGTAFDISADQAGQAMAEMRVAFGYSQDEVETLADKINYLGNTTPNAAAKLTTVVQRIGSLGKISGVSADQLAAMGASITSLEPEVVATGLKNMMINMTRGAAATKPMRAAWQDLGFTAEQVAKGMQEDSRAMIDSVLGAINKLPKEEQTSYINTIFGTEALPVVAQLATNTDALATNLNAMGDASKYAGSMQAEYQARSETTANQMELLKNNLTAAAVAVGDALLPAFNSLLETVTPVIEKFSDWASENPELVKGIVLVTGAVTGLVLAVSGIGLVASAFAALASPIGIAVAAIVGLTAAGVALYKNWDTIKAKASETWDSIKNTISNKSQQAIDAAKSAFDSLPGPIKDILTIAYNVVKTHLDLVKNAFTTVLNMVKALVRGDMQGVVDAFKQGMGNAWDIVKQGASNIISAFAGLGAKLFKLGSDAVAGLINGLKAKIGQVKQAAVDLGKAAWGGVKDFLHIRSPSRKMAELGRYAVDGLIVGIKDKESDAYRAAEQLAQSTLDGIAGLRKKIVLFGNDSEVAAFDYDVKHGKFKGLAESLIEEYRAELVKFESLKAEADARAKQRQEIANRVQQYTKQHQSAQDAFTNLKGDLQTESPMGRLIAEYEQRKEIILAAKEFEIGTAQERTDALLAIEQSFMDKKRDLLFTQSQELFSGLSGLAKSFAGEQSGIYRTLFAIEKGFAIAQSAIAIQQSIAKAMAVGFPQNVPLIGQAVSQGGQIISAIRSITMPVGQAHDGIMSVPKSGTWNLEKGERVLPAHTAKAMDRKLEQGGGVNVTVNNYSTAKVETKDDGNGNLIMTIRDEADKAVKRGFGNLANPNSYEAKQVSRNIQAPRKRA